MPDGKIVYRNLGLTSVTPDFEQTSRIAQVAKAMNIPVHIVDPKDPNSPGLNPFVIGSPTLCALVVSNILRSLYPASNVSAEVAYMEDLAHQAIQNVTILLKLMYPTMNNGLLPNLEDLLHCFTNFDIVQDMCEELKKDENLKALFSVQVAYFEQNFYKNSPGRRDMQRYVHFATAQLDYVTRAAAVKPILYNRHHNLDFASALANGEIILFCSRYTDIGGVPHRGLARFFLFLFMINVEDRLGNENNRLPHFLYIDDVDQYLTPAYTDLFNLFRKFKVGTVISTQNLSAIDSPSSRLMQTILANTPTKLSFGNCTPEDYAWWEKEFGERREWIIQEKYDSEKEHYSSDLGTVAWGWKDILNVAKQQGLGNKEVVFKVKDKYGKNKVSFGRVDFMASKYKEPHKSKTYNFKQYCAAVGNKAVEKAEEKPKKFDPKKIDFTGDVDPIQTDTTDSLDFFNNEDAISFNLNATDKNEQNT